MKARDVLADEVKVGWPPLLETIRIGPEAHRGSVIDKSVEPDIDDAVGSHGRGIPHA